MGKNPKNNFSNFRTTHLFTDCALIRRTEAYNDEGSNNLHEHKWDGKRRHHTKFYSNFKFERIATVFMLKKAFNFTMKIDAAYDLKLEYTTVYV